MPLTPNDVRFMADTDSASIQNAIDAAAGPGEDHVVIIPRVNARSGGEGWEIGKTILLPSEITVILDGCRLRLADGVFENVFRNRNVYTPEGLTDEGEQHGIRILGRNGATLDGGRDNGVREQAYRFGRGPHPRTGNLILLTNVRDYEIEGLRCVNLRYWAINQIACRGGRIRHISFMNGDLHPNQDGINVRIGCSDLVVEDVTGRTGDDVVALSAFPGAYDRRKGDYALLPYGRDPDIRDVTVRNVCANTRQTVVALRNSDGAKISRVTIENVTDCGGEYEPWGIVRLGENNYYRTRPSRLGEMSRITVRGVRSRARGTVFLSSALSESLVSDVYAGGTSMYAVSTFRQTLIDPENDCRVSGGVSMRDVRIENVTYEGSAGHCGDEILADVGEPFSGCALDFRKMRDTDTLENVRFRNVRAREGAALLLCGEKFAEALGNIE